MQVYYQFCCQAQIQIAEAWVGVGWRLGWVVADVRKPASVLMGHQRFSRNNMTKGITISLLFSKIDRFMQNKSEWGWDE